MFCSYLCPQHLAQHQNVLNDWFLFTEWLEYEKGLVPTLRELKIDLDNCILVFLFIEIAFTSEVNLILIVSTNGRV